MASFGDSKHKPGIAIVIGAGKPPIGGGGSKGPPPSWDSGDSEPDATGDSSAQPSDAGGQKVSPEDAGVYSSDQKCTACKYYIHDGHMCQKVEGNSFGLTDIGCIQFFEPEQEEIDDESGIEAPVGAPAPQGDQYGGSNTSTSG